jgi:hypothetical protein
MRRRMRQAGRPPGWLSNQYRAEEAARHRGKARLAAAGKYGFWTCPKERPGVDDTPGVFHSIEPGWNDPKPARYQLAHHRGTPDSDPLASGRAVSREGYEG